MSPTCTCTLTSGIVGMSLPKPYESVDQHHHHLCLQSTRKVERITSNYFVIKFTANHFDHLIL